MISVDRTIRTALAPGAAFSYLKDFENIAEWDPGTPVTDKLTDGPVAVGHRYRAVAEMHGKRHPLEYVVTELGEDSVTLRGENPTVVSVDTISVTPLRTGCSVRYRARFSIKGWKRVAEPFVRRRFDALAQPAMDGLQARLDQLAREQG